MIKGHRRSQKVMEGQGRSRKVMNGLFPSLDWRFRWEKLCVVWWWVVACRIIVSAPVPFLCTLDFLFGTWIWTGLGLDNNWNFRICACLRELCVSAQLHMSSLWNLRLFYYETGWEQWAGQAVLELLGLLAWPAWWWQSTAESFLHFSWTDIRFLFKV